MNVFVNATAAKEGGALTIVRQFLFALNEHGKDHKFYIFVNPEMVFESICNVEFVKIETSKGWDRFKWDYFGMQDWANYRDLKPDVIVSFQNIGVKFDDIPQIIYYHQMLPLVPYKWSPFSSKERVYFFYKYIYPFFVSLFLTNETKIVTQLDSIRIAFINKFKVPSSNVYSIRPDVSCFENSEFPVITFDDDKLHLFYAASPLLYKNHIDIVSAIKILSKKGLADDIIVHFTCSEDFKNDFVKKIHQWGLKDNFVFEGVMPYDKVFSYYSSVDAFLFPSYIETFGLPLIEAASVGLPILCNDLPFAREVLGLYSGVKFIELHNSLKWAQEIQLLLQNKKKRYKPLKMNQQSEWVNFFALIYNSKIK